MNTIKQHPEATAKDYCNEDDHRLWLSRVSGIDAWSYSVPLIASIKTPQQIIKIRNGILLRWQIAGRDIFSDLSPLPGFNTETIDSAYLQLKEALVDPTIKLYPSVDLAIYSARFQTEHADMNFLNGSKTTTHPHLQPCYLLSPDDIIPTEGFPGNCIKVKVGQDNIEQDINRIQQVCAVLGEKQYIRLDANGLFSHQQLEQLFNRIDLSKLDYIEDPFNNIEDYTDWTKRYSVEFAWDDLALYWHVNLDIEHQPKALVLKPLFLGFRKAWNVAREAHSRGIQIVFSSGYESSLSNQFYACLASMFSLDTPQGLDTDKYWSASLLTRSIVTTSGVQNNKSILQLSDLDYLGRLL